MNTLYETMKNVGFATVSLGQLLLLTVLVANLSDVFYQGFSTSNEYHVKRIIYYVFSR